MHTVMIIDDSAVSLSLVVSALEHHYKTRTITSGKKALDFLRKATALPDLILLDIDMPDMSGFETLQQLKAMEHLAAIPVLFLTGNNDPGTELKGLSLGAKDFITKPFTPAVLKLRVGLNIEILEQKRSLEDYNKHLLLRIEEKTQKIADLQEAIIYTIADLIEKKDGYTGRHTERVSKYVRVFLDKLTDQGDFQSISKFDVAAIALSARLHDVGKIAIPDSILLKKGKLEPEEFEIIKTHTSTGADSILKSMVAQDDLGALENKLQGDVIRLFEYVKGTSDNEFLKYAHEIARSHHEKWDGTGYPDKLSGTGIPLTARVAAIADVFDALRSQRPYKDGFSHAKSVEIIKSEAGKAFDPALVQVFLEIEDKFEELTSVERWDVA